MLHGPRAAHIFTCIHVHVVAVQARVLLPPEAVKHMEATVAEICDAMYRSGCLEDGPVALAVTPQVCQSWGLWLQWKRRGRLEKYYVYCIAVVVRSG